MIAEPNCSGKDMAAL